MCKESVLGVLKQATYLSLDTTNDLSEECISKIQPIGKRIQVFTVFIRLKMVNTIK